MTVKIIDNMTWHQDVTKINDIFFSSAISDGKTKMVLNTQYVYTLATKKIISTKKKKKKKKLSGYEFRAKLRAKLT